MNCDLPKSSQQDFQLKKLTFPVEEKIRIFTLNKHFLGTVYSCQEQLGAQFKCDFVSSIKSQGRKSSPILLTV